MDATQPQLPLDDAPVPGSALAPPAAAPSRRPGARPATSSPTASPPTAAAEPGTIGPGQMPLLLTVRDVEAALQLGRTRTYELVRSGELPVIRLGRIVRVPRDELERWIESHTASPE